MTHHIEDQEIRGISIKTVRWIVGSTITICLTLAANYYGIQKRFDQFSNHSMLQDLQIKTIQIQLEKQQAEIEIIKTNVSQLQIDIERVKAKINISN